MRECAAHPHNCSLPCHRNKKWNLSKHQAMWMDVNRNDEPTMVHAYFRTRGKCIENWSFVLNGMKWNSWVHRCRFLSSVHTQFFKFQWIVFSESSKTKFIFNLTRTIFARGNLALMWEFTAFLRLRQFKLKMCQWQPQYMFT